MRRKILTLLLCVSMTATMLAGYGTKEAPAADTDDAKTAPADAGIATGTDMDSEEDGQVVETKFSSFTYWIREISYSDGIL